MTDSEIWIKGDKKYQADALLYLVERLDVYVYHGAFGLKRKDLDTGGYSMMCRVNGSGKDIAGCADVVSKMPGIEKLEVVNPRNPKRNRVWK